jgi:hypothetical protein
VHRREFLTLAQVVAKAPRRRFTVSWYGGQTRRVELVWGEGYWYQAGRGMPRVTCSDALAAVRRLCWSAVLIKPWNHAGVTKLPRALRLTLLDQLCRAA